MGKRRALVIASQCDSLPELPFLTSRAEALYDVLTDATIGQCESVFDDVRSGLLLDGTVDEIETSIERAFQHASIQKDTLIVALIGHGWGDKDKYYYLAKNSPNPPTHRGGIPVARCFVDILGRYSEIDGLILLIDTCYSGNAAIETVRVFSRELKKPKRYEIVTATGSGKSAYDGCFTQAIVDTMKQGMANVATDTLFCMNLTGAVDLACRAMQITDHHCQKPDPGLFIGMNVAHASRERPWERTHLWNKIEKLTGWFQPTPALETIVNATRSQRCVAVVGHTGTGKSALVAALARSDVTEGRVPEGFVQAIMLINRSMDSTSLAKELSAQLTRSIPGFTKVQSDFEKSIPFIEWEKMDPMRQLLLGPLRRLKGTHSVRIVVDALDQLPESATVSVYQALHQLSKGEDFDHVHLVITCHQDTPLPDGAERIDLERAKDEDINFYFARRGLPMATRTVITPLVKGSWLVASVYANLISTGEEVAEELPAELSKLYDRVLTEQGATPKNNHWRKKLRPVLAILSVSGPGASLPIELLCTASGSLKGPNRVSQIRDVLVDLRGFVDRASPGTPREHDGLFHDTFSQHLLNPGEGQFGINGEEARSALIRAIAELAPRDEPYDPTNPTHKYAAMMEPQLLWELNRVDEARASRGVRESLNPAENLARWRSWETFLKTHLDADSWDILVTRSRIADLTGEIGDGYTALTLFTEVLNDQVRLLGVKDPETLKTRNNFAHWTGKTGKLNEALSLYKALLKDQVEVLGEDDPDTLITRNNIAYWTGEIGDARTALTLLTELLNDQERVRGKDDRHTLTMRGNIAQYTAITGEVSKALTLYNALLNDRVKLLGEHDRDTLKTRNNIAYWIGKAGEVSKALILYKALLDDQIRVLGEDHPSTLITRSNIAYWTGQTCKFDEVDKTRTVLALFTELLNDQVRVLGKGHRETLTTRNNIAYWTAKTGEVNAALTLFTELLKDQVQVLGKNDRDTLKTRSNIAYWTGTTYRDGQTDKVRKVLKLYKALLKDQVQVLGKNDRDTLKTRSNIAYWTGTIYKDGQTDKVHKVLKLFKALLKDQVRVLGKNDRDTLETRSNIAHYTFITGEVSEALILYKALLNDQVRVLGERHLQTCLTRTWMGLLTERMER